GSFSALRAGRFSLVAGEGSAPREELLPPADALGASAADAMFAVPPRAEPLVPPSARFFLALRAGRFPPSAGESSAPRPGPSADACSSPLIKAITPARSAEGEPAAGGRELEARGADAANASA